VDEGYEINIFPAKDIKEGKQAWIWDVTSGERYRINSNGNKITLDIGPAESILVVFDNESKGSLYKQIPAGNDRTQEIKGKWNLEFKHIDGSFKSLTMESLKDLKDIPEFAHFAGTIIYHKRINIKQKDAQFLNLGKVYGVSELKVNNKDVGVQWYGRRIYNVKALLESGDNTIEIKVVTVTGNYMKSLKNNAEAQYWTNEGPKIQPLQSMGLLGPVTIY
jgi:hypothetical protein